MINKLVFILCDLVCFAFIINPEIPKKIKFVPNEWSSRNVRFIYIVLLAAFGLITFELFN